MITTRDTELAARMRVMRLHGIDRDAFDRYRSDKPAWFYDVVAAGASLGGTSDSCFFASLPRTGDFDVRVRMEGFGPGEVWAKAGLMARSSSDPGAPFVAVFGTPANVGVGFMSRRAPGTG